MTRRVFLPLTLNVQTGVHMIRHHTPFIQHDVPTSHIERTETTAPTTNDRRERCVCHVIWSRSCHSRIGRGNIVNGKHYTSKEDAAPAAAQESFVEASLTELEVAKTTTTTEEDKEVLPGAGAVPGAVPGAGRKRGSLLGGVVGAGGDSSSINIEQLKKIAEADKREMVSFYPYFYNPARHRTHQTWVPDILFPKNNDYIVEPC